ncbi:hypothetical protein F2P81_012517 [Scophthalmus maximus]|uniref:Retinoblastoma-binding protein 5 n=1 Tax=Scophthalmus maximus TaxID=52904 RepID=A0A6A4SPU5_SCOMX|nr:hypothetical protein F2P81_012517 [Scophthalmus maximus]
MNLELLESFGQNYPEEADGTLDCISMALTCTFNRWGTLLAVGCNDGRIVIWDFLTRGIAKIISAHIHPVCSLCWSRDGHKLVSASTDNIVSQWDVLTGDCDQRFRFPSPILKLQCHPRDMDKVLVCPMKSAPVLLTLSDSKHVVLPVDDDSDLNVVAAFDRRGEYIYTGNAKGKILVLNTNTQELVASFRVTTGTSNTTAIKSIEFARKGSCFLINTADRIIRVYDGREILTCGRDGEPEPMQKLQDLVNRTPWKRCCFSGDGEYIVAGSARQHALYIWEKSIGNLVKILHGTRGELLLDVAVRMSERADAAEDEEVDVTTVDPIVAFCSSDEELEDYKALLYLPIAPEVEDPEENPFGPPPDSSVQGSAPEEAVAGGGDKKRQPSSEGGPAKKKARTTTIELQGVPSDEVHPLLGVKGDGKSKKKTAGRPKGSKATPLSSCLCVFLCFCVADVSAKRMPCGCQTDSPQTASGTFILEVITGSSAVVGGSVFRGRAAAAVLGAPSTSRVTATCTRRSTCVLSPPATDRPFSRELGFVVVGGMELDKMDENDWRYHGEGNKSLVVSHVQLSRVLRLLKYPAEDSENPPQTPEQAFRQIQSIVDFSSKVMSSLLGEKFIHSGPKCGFLPSSKHVSKDIKTKVCRFCMHQHYKVANGKWKRRSLYCPLDLFSGNKQRMHFAIRHLIEEPQNNFKIFKGGQCIYSSKEGSDDSMDLNSLLHHLRPYFLYGNNRINSHVTGKAVVNDFIQTQMLDTLDIEGLHPLYRRVEQHLQDFPKERTRLQIDGPYNQAFLEKLQKCPAEDDGSVDFAVAKVHQYRVAMTAKDCSIMVALVPGPEEEEEEDEGQRWLRDFLSSRPPAFSYSVSILDLDPKPFDGIPRQLRLDQRIVSCYSRTGAAAPKASLPPPPPPSAERDDCTLLFHPVHQYRVAMTAKDCSIMVALVPGPEEEEEEDEGQRWLRDFLSSRPPAFSYSVSILDLDPKPFDGIPRQLRLDQRIVSCYSRTGAAAPKASLPPPPPPSAERDDCTLLFHPV